MKVSFRYVSPYMKVNDPFNGNYIDMKRVPCVGEYVKISGLSYKVLKVTTELKGWKSYYTVLLEL